MWDNLQGFYSKAESSQLHERLAFDRFITEIVGCQYRMYLQ